ncbi:MAG: hypothetical protein M5U26_17820 [Planctomycetota bacterium]|nr:hypothetical protein [Planctomycetota bacterium]
MIEINLLPPEMRQSEGTPLPRLMSIIVGVVLAVIGGVFAANYYLVEIPRTTQAIDQLKRDQATLQETVNKVQKVQGEIATVQNKVAGLENLKNSRVLWARLLDRFSRAIPDQVTIKFLNFSPDAAPAFATTPEGARMRMNFDGFTAGETDQDCANKHRELYNSLKKIFEVPEEAPQPTEPPPPPPPSPEGLVLDRPLPPGYTKFLKLKFREPIATRFNPIPMPGLAVAVENVRVPPRGLDFGFTMGFSLLPPLQQ